MKATGYSDPFVAPDDWAVNTDLPVSNTNAAAAAAAGLSAAAADDGDADAYSRFKDHPTSGNADVVRLEQDLKVKQLLKPLTVLRGLQILCTSVFVILCLLVIPTRQRIHGAVLLPTVGANERETLPGGEREVGLQDDESALMVTLVVLTTSCLTFALSSLALTIVWLTFTRHPGRRLRSCGGNHTSCTRFTCDMSSDIAYSAVWAALAILSSLSVGWYSKSGARRQAGVAVGQVVLAALLLLLHVATAVLSGLIRRRMRQAAASRDVDVDGLGLPNPQIELGPGRLDVIYAGGGGYSIHTWGVSALELHAVL